MKIGHSSKMKAEERKNPAVLAEERSETNVIAEERNLKEEEVAEERSLFVQDVIESIGNDINGGTGINLVRSLIENDGNYCLFEDILEKDRLNEDIDLHDIRINNVIDHMLQMDSQKYTKLIDKNFLRAIRDSTMHIKMHMDGGANRSVTDDIRLLNNVKNIQPYVMSGAQKDDASIVCTKVGYIKLMCQGHGSIKVKTFYSPDIAETIISPGDITSSNDNNYTVWDQRCDHESNVGYIRFSTKSGIQSATVNTYLKNGIWYAHQSLLDCICSTYDDMAETPELISPLLRKLNAAATHELWHQRLCHPGKTTMETVHKTADGVPILTHGRNGFYKCQTCMRAKAERSAKHVDQEPSFKVERPGQLFHMDFGFVRGSDFKEKNEEGKIVTSRDGYNCYLIIVDRFSGYMWIMLSKNKNPPLEFVSSFLDKHADRQSPIRQVRTDQGGELWSSADFQRIVTESGFILEPTGAGNPKQNGVAESPNKSLGRLMRGMLYNAGLGSQYWSYALVHAVYIKNRLPHTRFNMKMSPYESLTGIKPNLSNLKVWGCRVVVKKPILRGAKLDDISSQGIFLRYTATTKNIVYLDLETNMEKISTDVVFDEANFITGSTNPGGKALMLAGKMKDKAIINKNDNCAYINVQQLNANAILPTRATPESAGLDIHAIEDVEIAPGSTRSVNTGLSIAVPKGTYGRLAPRSGNTVKKDIDVKAGVVDADFRGEVSVVLYNRGKQLQTFQKGDKIAQLILEKCEMHTPVNWTMKLEDTERGNKGFGSSDNIRSVNGQTKICENLILSENPYDNTVTVECKVKGSDLMLGLELDETTYLNKVVLIECKKGTSSARIPRWRSQLRGATILEINGTQIQRKKDVEMMIEQSKKENMKTIHITFATSKRVNIHSQRGIPQLFHDQLNILSTYQQELRKKERIVAHHCRNDEWESIVRQMNDENKECKGNKIVPNKLTRKWLMQQSDWDDWQKSEWKQLDQYQQQNMFGDPEPRPTKANILMLLWTYLVKSTGVKKARCCCNGNPGRQGSITLSHTYAACVEQPAQRVYWGIVALEGLIAVGADASNAFAEAPPPIAPLYVLIDKPYRDWYRSKGKGEIPKGHVLRVKHAIQGHPEAPRLWSTFIHDIIQNKIGLTPTTHEQCLYHGSFKGEKVYFLRQVDDFAVAAKSKETCDELIEEISKYLKAPLKNLGIVDRFNGVQIEQYNNYVKIHNKEYVEKILEKHGWLNDQFKTKVRPIPMRTESAYLRELELTKGPEDEKEKKKLELKMKFGFRQALGEVLYAMVTCRPDISMAVTKLSQYANNPAEVHYSALKNIFRYLRVTKNDGLYFWRKEKQNFTELTDGTLPKVYSDQKELKGVEDHKQCYTGAVDEDLIAFTDSDWAGDVGHRRSVTGMAIFLGGSVVAYKSKFQPTVALSSTEAEFSAACETGKVVLYLRSILEEIGVSQDNATVVYEDNQGAIMMANARQPTRRTRHIETAQFALIDWVEKDLLCLKFVESSLNCADAMNKPLSRIQFYKHFDRIMGRMVPNHIKTRTATKTKENTTNHTD